MSTFPQLIYRAPGPIVRARHSYAAKAVKSQQELEINIDQGWFTTLEEALEAAGPRASRVSKLRSKPVRKPSQPFTRERAKPQAAALVKDATVDDNQAPTRSEIEQKAIELGVKFDGRTTDKKLLERIERALKEA